MPIPRIVIGDLKEATHPDTLKAAVAEFISMLIYIFAAEGFAASSKLISTGASSLQLQLTSAAINHAFAFLVAFTLATNVSGGHVNPAITFGVFVGGHITFCRSVVYWIAQVLGSIAACSLLEFSIVGLEVSPYPPSPRNAIAFEIVMSFGLVYTVYATAIDPKRRNLRGIAPIAISCIVGANILCGGGIYGAAMNPAAPFGQAVVSWTWKNHWVFWLGTFIGAAIAALVYETIFICKNTNEQQPTTAKDVNDDAFLLSN